jgi:GTP-binding protein HflX
VEAFRATLEETTEANLLLHVVDAANEMHDVLMSEVDAVLEEIGAAGKPMLLVFNKIDLLDGREPGIDRDASGRPQRVWLSARTGKGVDLLLQAVCELLAEELIQEDLVLQPGQARLRSRLYARGAVLDESVDDEGLFHLKVRVARNNLIRMLNEEGWVKP